MSLSNFGSSSPRPFSEQVCTLHTCFFPSLSSSALNNMPLCAKTVELAVAAGVEKDVMDWVEASKIYFLSRCSSPTYGGEGRPSRHRGAHEGSHARDGIRKDNCRSRADQDILDCVPRIGSRIHGSKGSRAGDRRTYPAVGRGVWSCPIHISWSTRHRGGCGGTSAATHPESGYG